MILFGTWLIKFKINYDVQNLAKLLLNAFFCSKYIKTWHVAYLIKFPDENDNIDSKKKITHFLLIFWKLITYLLRSCFFSYMCIINFFCSNLNKTPKPGLLLDISGKSTTSWCQGSQYLLDNNSGMKIRTTKDFEHLMPALFEAFNRTHCFR